VFAGLCWKDCVADLDIFGEAHTFHGGIVQCHVEIEYGSRASMQVQEHKKDLFSGFFLHLACFACFIHLPPSQWTMTVGSTNVDSAGVVVNQIDGSGIE